MFIDTHAHLNSKKFDEDLEEVIKNAHNNCVSKMIIVGYDHEGNKKAIELAEKYDGLYAVVGIHPLDVDKATDEHKIFIVESLQNPKVVGLGETGLDYYYSRDYIDSQKEWFKWHLDMAKLYNKPVVIHSRDAIQETYDILSEYKDIRAVLHCYSGSVEMAKRFQSLGVYISLAGPITFKNANSVRDVAKNVNLDLLLAETDCPYMAPEPNRGKRNEPANVRYVVNEISKQRQETSDKVEEKIYENSIRFFGIE